MTMPNQHPQPDPRGWLAFDGPLPDDLQRAEDSTAAADFDRYPKSGKPFERLATDAEKALLTHLGYEVQLLPSREGKEADDLITEVRFVTTATRNRRWPQIEKTLEVKKP